MASLTLAGSFPARVEVGGSTFEGSVTVVNDGAGPVELLAASRPDITVLEQGRLVMPALPRDEVGMTVRLAPGAGRELAAAGAVPPLPGRYEIRAALQIAGEQPVLGGPWTLEVAGAP